MDMKSESVWVLNPKKRNKLLNKIYKVNRRTKENTKRAINRLLGSISDQVLIITSDNGKEFANHEKIAKGLKCDFYFAHPYSSWKRGTNENTNGLIRQYFPKNRDFRTIGDEELIHAMKRLNNRPRKRLGFKTPNEVFFSMVLINKMLHLLLESRKHYDLKLKENHKSVQWHNVGNYLRRAIRSYAK